MLEMCGVTCTNWRKHLVTVPTHRKWPILLVNNIIMHAFYHNDITTLQVKGRVDEFKEHLPLLSALFNPGLRDRHWEKMSEIAGQDLRPNEVDILTIMNICKLCLRVPTCHNTWR